MRPLDPAVLPHLRPARWSLALAVGAGMAGGLLAVAQAFALGTLLVRLVQGQAWHAAAAWLLAVVALRALTAYAGDTASATAAGRVAAALRRRVLHAALRMVPERLAERGTAALGLLATRGVSAVEPYLTRYLPALVTAALLPPATLLAVWWLDPLSGLVVLLTLPLVPVFAALVGMATRDRAERQWRRLGALSGHFLDVVRGLPTLVAHRRARAQARTIASVTDAYRRATLDTLRLAFASSFVLELVATLSVALVAVEVGVRLAAGHLDLRTAMIVLLLAPEAYWPLRRVGAEFHAAAEGLAGFADADAVLAEPTAPTLKDGPLAARDLTLGYQGRPLLHLDHVFAPGVTAVVGPSGCGKSTLLAALAGRLTPLDGLVTSPGPVAYVPQRPWLSEGTIAENVRLGAPGLTDHEVWWALEEVDLGATVAALPEGVATRLGEDGAGLSAGQRARLALARAAASGRSVVLLDEPTAHLDPVTEAVTVRVLRRLGERATVVVVAHREAVVEAADQVLELPPITATPATRSPWHPGERVTGVAAPVVGEPTTPSRFGARTATLLGALSLASGVALTATAGWLITRAAAHPPVLVLTVAIVGVRLFGLARPVLRYAERLVSHDVALRLLARRRVEVYEALVPLVPGALGRRRGDLLTAVVDDVEAVVDERLRVRQPLLTAALVGLGAAGVVAAVRPAAAIAVLLPVGAAAVAAAASFLAARRTEPGWVAARAELSTRVTTLLDAAPQLVLWGAHREALAGVDDASGRLAQAARSSARASAAGRALVVAACGAGPVLVGLLVPDRAVGGPVLALLALVPLALVDALLPLPDAAALAVRTRAATARLDALLRTPAAVVDPTAPARAHGGDLRLAGVDVDRDGRAVLRGVGLELSRGRRVGVVGPSGSGKSTLAALPPRFLDATAGLVELGGTDVRRLALDDVRARVGVVDDDPYVFATTLGENVRLARPGADDREVADALVTAGLGDWVAGLPGGTVTMLGEGHHQVSGGERARLGLARAMLAEADVLVLDEPTAHLDTATARAVISDVLAATTDRALLWISHDGVGLPAMDQVLDLATMTSWPGSAATSSPTPSSSRPR
ncbi:thiol reductant ABC exporter subunit CydD [Nocardioides mangrovicus]|uniref:Thiol reductant ABC exporter subunit CydD n=1 Tax=Nocardioides mangrovicus TaxID=2478913 RepID=A0A3L8P0E3_9ACTN|nr:thiol reductant ABC exporter subunit CydD [Nocardioides mangrovicus]RLV48915.1 thiol reductant ABC exporter subunit CydD [Nocardioides mangrovicus]